MARQGGRLSLCAEALIAPNHPPQSHRPGGPSGPPHPFGTTASPVSALLPAKLPDQVFSSPPAWFPPYLFLLHPVWSGSCFRDLPEMLSLSYPSPTKSTGPSTPCCPCSPLTTQLNSR